MPLPESLEVLPLFPILAVGLVSAGVWLRRLSGPVRLRASKELSLIATLSSLVVASRLSLAAFPNIKPVAFFTATSGILLGPYGGFSVGLLGMSISDLFFGVGPWTLVTAPAMGMVGAFSGMIWSSEEQPSRFELALGGYLLVLAYDLTTSLILSSALFGVPWPVAILMLFTPASGGFPYPPGPAHELSTALLLSLVGPALIRRARALIGGAGYG